ncbi:hypothetical protein HYPSUDRAFT_143028 [Hypholoma sublateritium FD-334 SS-4]|uniref:Zn(2)-C6 fungal-type domain-containing protein n=1 Tax=Hypholoma sublateritium (strain FD-334 SS-4) TaxID=945553 RepID=A0A0D2NM44_HYPSF|nr:hypothetical protein HYPSUDRAFT_143028 [Hypholoma sublateritium FD-334 SS-4]
MANKPSSDSNLQSTLQRGKACLRCRKRKMRCDGQKPSCQQCTRAKKADGCEYDDGKGKTRTQILRETIVRLEQRVRELEDPEYVSPAVTLFDPNFHSRSNSSSSESFGSPESSYLSASHSPFPSDSSPASPPGSWAQLHGMPSPSPAPFLPEVYFDDNHARFQPPLELAQMLVDIFTPHSRQCGLEIHMGRLRESLSLPASEQRHPALLNSVYLWACFISRPEPLSQHEEHYLQHTLQSLPDGLRTGGKLVDVIQASCLLSLYFLANGRLLEGSYHASAAAALAVQCGLSGKSSFEGWSSGSDSEMKPTVCDVREGERILAFWQVYNLDRCWSVVLRKPCLIPDKSDLRRAILSPWPQDIKDYENGHVDTVSAMPTIRSFLSGAVSASSFSTPALRVKASALFAHADHLAASWNPNAKTSSRVSEEMRSLEHTIALFLSRLVPVNQLDSLLPEERHSIVMAHTLAHSATIHLHRSFALDDSMSFEKSSQAAQACITLIKQLSERDFAFLEPMIGPCWWSVADIVIRDLDTLEASWPLADYSDLRNDLGILLYAMTSLSTRFPIVAPAVSKVQKRLASR